MKNVILFLLSVLFLPFVVNAQQQSGSKVPPKAILVQLGAQQNRMNYFQSKGNEKMLRLLQQDNDSIAMVTINDFKDHFGFCPVYYFYDTNQALIKEKKFAGVLLDENRNPVQNPVITETDSNFLIVYYGMKKAYAVAKNNSTASTGAAARGLVVLNHRFMTMQRKFPAFYGHSMISLKKRDKKYNYASSDFDMEYLESAQKLNDALVRYYAD